MQPCPRGEPGLTAAVLFQAIPETSITLPVPVNLQPLPGDKYINGAVTTGIQNLAPDILVPTDYSLFWETEAISVSRTEHHCPGRNSIDELNR